MISKLLTYHTITSSILGIINLFPSVLFYLINNFSLSYSMKTDNMLSNMELSNLEANLHLSISVKPWKTFPPFLKHLLMSSLLSHQNTHSLMDKSIKYFIVSQIYVWNIIYGRSGLWKQVNQGRQVDPVLSVFLMLYCVLLLQYNQH